jgi:hypothetical protein
MLAEIEDLPRQLKQETNKGKTFKEEHLRALLAMLVESKGKQALKLQQIYASVATDAKL